MQMDSQWMYNADRYSKKFIDSFHYFLICPRQTSGSCIHYQNKKDYSFLRILHNHIFANSFMSNYICWISHGEKGVIMKDNEEENFDGNFSGHAGFGTFDDDAAMEEPGGEAADDEELVH
jgi:hypothetical protein